MDERAALNLLGLAMRAGQVKSGDDVVERAVRAGRARLVLIDGGASRNTREKYEALCGARGIAIRTVTEDAMGLAIGKPGRMVAAMAKGTLSDKVEALLSD